MYSDYFKRLPKEDQEKLKNEVKNSLGKGTPGGDYLDISEKDIEEWAKSHKDQLELNKRPYNQRIL